MSDSRIVVTGISSISGIGKSADDVYKSIVGKKTNIIKRQCIVDGKIWEEFYVHKNIDFNLKEVVKNSAVINWITDWKEGKKDIDFEFFSSIVGQALNDANIDQLEPKKKMGLFLVHENQGLENIITTIIESACQTVQIQLANGKSINKLEVMKSINEACDKLGYDTQSFMHLFFIAKLFNINGFSIFSNNACASGLYAIENASQQIKCGRLESAVVAGMDQSEYVYKYLWFKNMNIYAQDGLIKPFARNRNGFIFGEGGAALILEDYNHAKKRGAKIYAEYSGGGFYLESSKVSLPNVSSPLYSSVILDAIANSKLKLDDIDLINPHGIAECVTDQHEANSIKKAFGEIRPPVTALKPYVGHNLGSSALLELALLIVCVSNKYIPPILNYTENDSKINLNLQLEGENKKVTNILKLSCGFAGYNAAVVFKNMMN